MTYKKTALVVLMICICLAFTACLSAQERHDIEIWEMFEAGNIDAANDLVHQYYVDDEAKMEVWTKLMIDESMPKAEAQTTPELRVDYNLQFKITEERLDKEGLLFNYSAVLTNTSDQTYKQIEVIVEGYDRYGKPLVSRTMYVLQALAPDETVNVSCKMVYEEQVGYYLAYVVEAKAN